MAMRVPPAVNYQSPLNMVPSRVLDKPKEGPHQIAVEVDWAIMGGADQAVTFNLAMNATQEFSQIIALKVDNSMCGASVRFIFPDNTETVTIPAYMPAAIIEVFTNALQFYLVADGAIDSDVTRFQILNFLPPPVVVPATTEQQSLIIGNISAAVAGPTVLLNPDVSGTIQGLQVNFGCASPAGDSNVFAVIQDGNGKYIARVPMFVKTGVPINAFVPFMDIDVRFENGLIITIGGLLVPAGEYNVNLFYRIP